MYSPIKLVHGLTEDQACARIKTTFNDDGDNAWIISNQLLDEKDQNKWTRLYRLIVLECKARWKSNHIYRTKKIGELERKKEIRVN